MKPLLLPTKEQREQAIAGTKTQFRLVAKKALWPIFEESEKVNGKVCLSMMDYDITPPHAIGDILYHAEPYHILWAYKGDEIEPRACKVGYLDDNETPTKTITVAEFDRIMAVKFPYKNISARNMPPFLARYFYSVTNVRAGELQKISEADAKAEGVDTTRVFNHEVVDGIQNQDQYRPSFIDLWDSTHKKPYTWDDNPYVWIFDIKRIERPVK